MSTKISLTKAQYQTLDEAYNFFNEKLFNKELPDCMIVMQRKGKNNLGYYHPERYINRASLEVAKKSKKKIKADIDELSLNPDNFIGCTDTAILSTLVHEMVHVWQFHCTEKYPRNGYHDKVWGKKMDEIGLTPSNTGKEGGKRTGQQMHHYIILNGLFEKHCLKFLSNRQIKLSSFPLPKQASASKNKTKYSCPVCEQNAWAKPGANIQCGDCDEKMEEV
jgi:predicted SprT family Zn-dependent metalloprotease